MTSPAGQLIQHDVIMSIRADAEALAPERDVLYSMFRTRPPTNLEAVA
jgi:hypothetical protein